MFKRRRDIATLRALSSILSAVDARAGTMTREHRQSLVREENYKRFVDALLSSVFVNVAQVIGGSPQRTKSLLEEIAKASPKPTK